MNPKNKLNKNRGFTLIELLVVIAIISLLVGILLPALARARALARQLKDATQVRTVVQGMVVFANSNEERYPLPSRLDTSNATIAVAAGQEWQKNRTGDILSILIFSGSLNTEGCISPAESNTGLIQRDDNYRFSDPQGTPSPANALWDPGFAGTPIDAGPGLPRRNAQGQLNAQNAVGHQSYAHNIPVGRRLAKWSNTFATTEAVFGNRGPSYQQSQWPGANQPYTLNPPGHAAPGVDSMTLLIHGSRNAWSGNIGYNDGHVTFETKPNPDGVTCHTTNTPSTVPDNLFIDELNERGQGTPGQYTRPGARSNNYLRLIASWNNAEQPNYWKD